MYKIDIDVKYRGRSLLGPFYCLFVVGAIYNRNDRVFAGYDRTRSRAAVQLLRSYASDTEKIL